MVFLDIDGVLNTYGTGGEGRPYVAFDDAAMARLKVLLEKSGASIVLSTFWRKHLAYLNHVFANYGLLGQVSPRSGPERPIASEMRTPVFKDPERRDLEILRWLQLHQAELGVEAWVALDDLDLLVFRDTRKQLVGHVVRTDPQVGLTDADVATALELLDAQCPRGGSLSADAGAGGATCVGIDTGLAMPPHAAGDIAAGMAGALHSAMGPMDEDLMSGMSAVLAALGKEGSGPTSELLSDPLAVAARVAAPLLCPDGHSLQHFKTTCTGFCCEDCGDDLAEGQAAFTCPTCNGVCFCDRCARPSALATTA